MLPLAQAGLTAPAVAGQVDRGVRPHSRTARDGDPILLEDNGAAPSRLTAERGRYSAAAGQVGSERLAQRVAARASCSLH
jgi:hypothetical protein